MQAGGRQFPPPGVTIGVPVDAVDEGSPWALRLIITALLVIIAYIYFSDREAKQKAPKKPTKEEEEQARLRRLERLEQSQQPQQQPPYDEPQQMAQQDPQSDECQQRTRSGRVTRPPNWHNEYQSLLQTQAHPESRTLEYSIQEARVIAMLLQYMEDKS